MMTLRQFSDGLMTVPAATAWLVGDLGVSLGQQALFTRQSPQRLRVLREHAVVESAVSSNRIEGVEVDAARVGTLVFGSPAPRDRDEEELKGYRSALDWIHREGAKLPVTAENLSRLHQVVRGEIWDAGKFKLGTEPIIERSATGRTRVRFTPVQAGAATEAAVRELFERWSALEKARQINSLVLSAGFVLDFLCIHPFRDGNGRVSRLLMLLLSYHGGLEVGRYISLERLIEQNKDRYYQTLEQSSQQWHQGRHNPWPFVNFSLWVLKKAFQELEERVGESSEPLGAKSEAVRQAVYRRRGAFRLVDIEIACPGVGRDWIRAILRQMRADGELTVNSRGTAARWEIVAGRGGTLP